MAVELRIKGAEEFARVARRLRAMGEEGKGLRKELYAGLNRAAKPAKAAIKPNLVEELPHKGGAGDFIASTLKVTQSNRSAGKNPAITIWSRSNHDIRKIDRGQLRHPVFGNRKKWADTSVKANTFTDPIEERAPEIRAEMEKVIRDVAAKIGRGH